MKELFEVTFKVSMFAFVAGSMAALGLGLDVSQIIAPFKKKRMVILSLIANFVLVPLFAFSLLWILPVSEGTRKGIILLALGGGATFTPLIVARAKSFVGGAIGLMLLLLTTTFILLPIVLPLIFSGALVNPWDITRSLVSTMMVPLALALLIRARFSAIAILIQPYVSKIASISALILAITIVKFYTKTIISNLSTLPIVVLFVLGAMLIGYLTGGKSRDARIILAIGTALRNPPVAILVANQSFPAEPMVAIIPLLGFIIAMLILFPWAKSVQSS